MKLTTSQVLPMANDSLSALFDGECSPEELDRLLEELDAAPALGAQWSRLCAGRAAEEGVLIKASQPCLVAGVMAALDVAPASSVVVDLAVRRASRGAVARRFWKPAVGFAAAASMGAAAVLVLGNRGAEPSFAAGGPIAAAPSQVMAVRYEDPAYNAMMNDYVAEHTVAAEETVGTPMLRDMRLVHNTVYRIGDR